MRNKLLEITLLHSSADISAGLTPFQQHMATPFLISEHRLCEMGMLFLKNNHFCIGLLSGRMVLYAEASPISTGEHPLWQCDIHDLFYARQSTPPTLNSIRIDQYLTMIINQTTAHGAAGLTSPNLLRMDNDNGHVPEATSGAYRDDPVVSPPHTLPSSHHPDTPSSTLHAHSARPTYNQRQVREARRVLQITNNISGNRIAALLEHDAIDGVPEHLQKPALWRALQRSQGHNCYATTSV